MNTDVIRTLSGYYEKAEYLESLFDIRQGMQEQYTEDQYRVSGRANRNRKYRNIAIVCGGVIAFPQFVTPLLGMDPVFGNAIPVLILLAIVLFFAYNAIRKNNEQCDQLEKNLIVLEEGIVGMTNQIENLVRGLYDSGNLQEFPYQYFHTEALRFMIDALQKNYARDFHEAVVLYENERKHRATAEQQRQLAALRHEDMIGLAEAVDFNSLITYLTSGSRRD